MRRISNLEPVERFLAFSLGGLGLIVLAGYLLPSYWNLAVDVLVVLAVVAVGIQQMLGWAILRLCSLIAVLATVASGVMMAEVASQHDWSGARWIMSTITVAAALTVLGMVAIWAVLSIFGQAVSTIESD